MIFPFHSGSFLWAQGRQADCGFAASTLVKHISATAPFVQYRLAYDPACPFPAAVQHALTAYTYLLDMGFPASKIVLCGDSAGGNIAIALFRYLCAPEDHELPSPAALLLWSPSIDLALQLNPSIIDDHKNNIKDFLTGFTLVWGLSSYVPKSVQASDLYLSPIRHPFATKTPVWVMVGCAEVLYDSIVSFYNLMRSTGGNRVELYGVPSANHDILLRMSYAWYHNCPEDELPDILMDIDGHEYWFSPGREDQERGSGRSRKLLPRCCLHLF